MCRTIGRYVAAFALSVVSLAGCADIDPVEPIVQEPQLLLGLIPDAGALAEFRSGLLSLFAPRSAARWIGPEGGSVELPGFEVVVPKGAVSGPTRFSIRLPGTLLEAKRAFAEFEPHGVRFAVPVTIRLPYRGTSAEGRNPSIIWWDGAAWVRYSTTLRSDGLVEALTDHFSVFGTEDPGRGITPVGG
jgi:hypothetical protein